MLTKTRNKVAGTLALVGGLLILIAGGTGMAAFLSDLKDIIEDLMGSSNQTLETIFWILIFIAALGGISVMIGGLLIIKNHVVIGKILIALGAGMGIIGLILSLITTTYRGESGEFLTWLTTSFMGIGLILSLIARFAAKRPSLT